jgi:putative SOS response-associated peptidase YedK
MKDLLAGSTKVAVEDVKRGQFYALNEALERPEPLLQ